jgi:hypothetical protein
MMRRERRFGIGFGAWRLLVMKTVTQMLVMSPLFGPAVMTGSESEVVFGHEGSLLPLTTRRRKKMILRSPERGAMQAKRRRYWWSTKRKKRVMNLM